MITDVKKLLIILVSFILIVSVGGCNMRNSKSEQEQLTEFARSSEAREVYERTIKNLDPNAFTSEGKIQSYEVDETSVKKNPMGVVMVTLLVNNNSDYLLGVGLVYDLEEEQIRNPGTSISKELRKFLEE